MENGPVDGHVDQNGQVENQVQEELVENLQNEQAQQGVELDDDFLEGEQEDGEGGALLENGGPILQGMPVQDGGQDGHINDDIEQDIILPEQHIEMFQEVLMGGEEQMVEGQANVMEQVLMEIEEFLEAGGDGDVQQFEMQQNIEWLEGVLMGGGEQMVEGQANVEGFVMGEGQDMEEGQVNGEVENIGQVNGEDNFFPIGHVNGIGEDANGNFVENEVQAELDENLQNEQAQQEVEGEQLDVIQQEDGGGAALLEIGGPILEGMHIQDGEQGGHINDVIEQVLIEFEEFLEANEDQDVQQFEMQQDNEMLVEVLMGGGEQMVEGQANVEGIVMGEGQDMEEGQANVEEILIGGGEENVEGQANENVIDLYVSGHGGNVFHGEVRLGNCLNYEDFAFEVNRGYSEATAQQMLENPTIDNPIPGHQVLYLNNTLEQLLHGEMGWEHFREMIEAVFAIRL